MKVFYFDDVVSFISALDQASKSHVLRLIKMLTKYGLQLRPPESKKIARGIYELRVQGNLKIRILYTVRGNVAYLLAAFIKKSSELPKHEISKAQQ